MARLVRLHPRGRRRFRDRVLVAMLVVALLPLVIFSVVVARDLNEARSSTVDSANSAILDDAKGNQQAQLASRVSTVQNALDNAASQLRGVRDSMLAALGGAVPATAPAVLARMGVAGGVAYADDRAPGGSQPSTVIVGEAGSVNSGERAPAVLNAWRQSAAAEPAMEAIRGGNRAIQYVWVADGETTLVRVLPPVPVPTMVESGRMAPDSPLGDTTFSALAAHPGDAADGATWEGEPAGPGGIDLRPDFTTTYLTGVPGAIGMTVSMAVGAGSHYRVGVDLDVRQLLGDIVTPPVSDQRGAYNLLLDSSGRLLGGGDAVTADFGLSAATAWGSTLHPADAALRDNLARVLATGRQEAIQGIVGRQEKLFLTASLPSAHWVLLSVVPLSDLLPARASLTRGIDEGVTRILRDAVVAGLALCVVTFVLASLLARRVVAPVKALTAAAERLGSGDTEVPVPPAGEDEVGLLAESLERMRREVNASRDGILAAARELEGRVQERTAELRERNEELVALNALAGSLTRSLDPQVILDGAIETLRVVLPISAARAFVVNEARLESRVWWADRARTEPPPVDADALSGVCRDAVDSHDLTLRSASDGVLVGIPLETHEGPLGAIGVLARPGWRLGGRSRALVRAVGDQVGLALRTAALSAEGRELAVLEERTRLAREIHDTIAQQLTAVILQLEAAEALLSRDAERSRSIVAMARDQARSALQEARQSVWNLRPRSLDSSGLAGAVSLEVAAWQRRTGIATAVRTQDLPRSATLPPQTEVALFRIVQEALTNVANHSHAARAEVRLEMVEGDLQLVVRDDGDGFETGETRLDAFGLVGMEERARLIGAELTITSAPGTGTEICVRLPLSAPATTAAVVPE